MCVRIIDRHPFHRGGVVEGLVGGNQRHRAESVLPALLADFQGGGQLHGVVGAERMPIRQPHGVVEQGGGDLDDGVAAGEMLAEAVEDRRCLGGDERPAFAAAGNGGRDFNGGNAGDANGRGWAVARDAANPGGADLLDVTLDQGAGIHKKLITPKRVTKNR